MKNIAVSLIALILLISPARAEDAQAGDLTDGLNLIEEGAKLFLRDLFEQVEPSLDDLQDGLADLGPAVSQFLGQVGPELAQLLDRVDDLRHYQAPEILPNGDIILRRLPDAPEWAPETQTDDDTAIDL